MFSLPLLVAPLDVRVVDGDRRVRRQLVRVADVRLVGSRIDHVDVDPLALGSERQPVAFGRLRRRRVDAEPVRGQLPDANRRVRQRGERVERPPRLCR